MPRKANLPSPQRNMTCLKFVLKANLQEEVRYMSEKMSRPKLCHISIMLLHHSTFYQQKIFKIIYIYVCEQADCLWKELGLFLRCILWSICSCSYLIFYIFLFIIKCFLSSCTFLKTIVLSLTSVQLMVLCSCWTRTWSIPRAETWCRSQELWWGEHVFRVLQRNLQLLSMLKGNFWY